MVATKDTMMNTAKRPVVYARWLQDTDLIELLYRNEDFITISPISFDLILRFTPRLTFVPPIEEDWP